MICCWRAMVWRVMVRLTRSVSVCSICFIIWSISLASLLLPAFCCFISWPYSCIMRRIISCCAAILANSSLICCPWPSLCRPSGFLPCLSSCLRRASICLLSSCCICRIDLAEGLPLPGLALGLGFLPGFLHCPDFCFWLFWRIWFCIWSRLSASTRARLLRAVMLYCIEREAWVFL